MTAAWERRRNIRAVEELADGRVLATLDDVHLESWLPTGERQWVVRAEDGGQDIVVSLDERSAWIYHGHGLQPGGSFVVRRTTTTGELVWIFRTDRKWTALDAHANTVFVTYDDGELVVLDLRSGAVLSRGYLAIGDVPIVATALTVPASDRLLIGTSDGRILICSVPVANWRFGTGVQASTVFLEIRWGYVALGATKRKRKNLNVLREECGA